MKKLIFITLIILTAFTINTPKSSAKASVNYAMVITENACFWSDASQKYLKFYLPYSYFVKVVTVGAEYSRVIYMDGDKNHPECEGYVKTSDLNFEISPSDSPYPKLTLFCETSDVLFSDVEIKSPLTVINKNTQAIYYGEITHDAENYVFVYANGYAGYVRKSAFSSFSLPTHESLAELISRNESEKSTNGSQPNEIKSENTFDVFGVKTIIIAVALIVLLCFIYVILRPDKSLKSEHSFFKDYDE